MALGGLVQGLRGYFKASMDERLQDLNFKRDLDHATRNQAQHSRVLADLDLKMDKVIVFIQRQEARLTFLESIFRRDDGRPRS